MVPGKIINIQPKAWDDMQFWLLNDRKILNKIFDLVKAITDNPFTGIGKPEPLKVFTKDTGAEESMMNIVSFIK